jgi:hypothetical protein
MKQIFKIITIRKVSGGKAGLSLQALWSKRNVYESHYKALCETFESYIKKLKQVSKRDSNLKQGLSSKNWLMLL